MFLAVIAAAGAESMACTACFGQSDSPMAKGMNMGIFTLLLVITCVLAGVASFFVYLIRRGSQLAEARQQLPAGLSEHRTNA
jgi:hypothetical protein